MDIHPRDAFRPIARERKYLMDYKLGYLTNGGRCDYYPPSIIRNAQSLKTLRYSPVLDEADLVT